MSEIVVSTLRLRVDMSTGDFYDLNTKRRPVFWRSHQTKVILGVFNGQDMLDLSSYVSLVLTIAKTVDSDVIAAQGTTTTLTATPGANNWDNGNAAHGEIVFSTSDTDLALFGGSVATYWLRVQGVLKDTNETVTFAAGYLDIKKSGLGYPQPPFGYVSENTQENDSGNSTVTPTSLSHIEFINFTGSAGDRRIILDTDGMEDGATVKVRCLMPAISDIVLSAYNEDLDGTQLATYTSDSSGEDVLMSFGFSDGAWKLMGILPRSEFVLSPATATELGGIKVGTGLTVEEDGTLNGANQYTLPVASDTTLGGVKVAADSGLAVSSEGFLSITSVARTFLWLTCLGIDSLSTYPLGNYSILDGGFSWPSLADGGGGTCYHDIGPARIDVFASLEAGAYESLPAGTWFGDAYCFSWPTYSAEASSSLTDGDHATLTGGNWGGEGELYTF